MTAELKNILILGDGFLTKSFSSLLSKSSIDFDISSRTKPDRLTFDFEKKSTWKNISKNYSHSLLTFPLSQPQLAKEFFETHRPQLGKCVIVSSTGFFNVEDGATVKEDSPIDHQIERAQAEEKLRELGAIVLHAAGIYGPGRNPLDWVKQGRVGKSDKLVNFIHVEDLSEFCLKALSIGRDSSRYIASDGNPMPWRLIIEKWEEIYGIESVEKTSKRSSKRVDPQNTIQELQISLKFKNVIDGVTELTGA